jgi:hypothetical protein
MDFNCGSVVVISAFKKFKVGKIVDTFKNTYTVQTEDLKVYDNINTDSKNSVYIHTGITKSFLKNNKNGNK